MKYFTDANNEVWAFPLDGSQDDFIPKVLTAISDEEAEQLRQPPPLTTEQQIEMLKAELNQLEQSALMPRGARETEILAIPLLTLLLSTLTTQQKAAMDSIKAQLIAGNPHYKNLVDTDSVAATLRAQIKAL